MLTWPHFFWNRLSMTTKLLLSLSTTLLCLLGRSKTALAQETFADCLECANKLPDLVQCFVNEDGCDIMSCDMDGATIDFEDCGCLKCVEPMFECLDDCTPSCLDTIVDPFITCLLDGDNKCFSNCIGYQGVGNAVTFPPITPAKDCDFSTFMEDWRNCLPEWPSCQEVQDTAIDATCDATSCCSPCYKEKLDIEECVYRWLSGKDCDFTCTDDDSRDTELELVETKRSGSGEEPPAFVEECRGKLVRDLLLAPDASFNDYVQCIMSNSMEYTADESNRPVTNAPTEQQETTQGSTTTSGGASGGRWIVALPISVVVFAFSSM